MSILSSLKSAARPLLRSSMRANLGTYRAAGRVVDAAPIAGRILRRGSNGTTLPWFTNEASSVFNYSYPVLNPTIARRLILPTLGAGVGIGAIKAYEGRDRSDGPGDISVYGNMEIKKPGMLDATGSMVFSMRERGKT